MKIINRKNNIVLADKVAIADTLCSRVVGLLNRCSLAKGEALILKPCWSIHTLFMRFAIDVLFIDKNGKILAALPSIKPFRFSPIYINADLAIELPENTIQTTQTQSGDIIQIQITGNVS